MLRDLIAAAVEKHVGPDTGVLLSGGIDSSTVAYFAPELPVFTGYYKGAPYDERPWARLMQAGREWHEIEITPQHFIDHFDTMVERIGPPTEGPGTFGQYMVSRYVSEHVSTVLSGEGGDELFGGYARLHRRSHRLHPRRRSPVGSQVVVRPVHWTGGACLARSSGQPIKSVGRTPRSRSHALGSRSGSFSIPPCSS